MGHDEGAGVPCKSFLEDFSGVDSSMGQGASEELLALNEV
jgi:hypothetical protein